MPFPSPSAVRDTAGARPTLSGAVPGSVEAGIPICRPDLPPLEELTDLLGGVWDTRMLSNFGPLSRTLEEEAAARLGVERVLAVASGDTGLMATVAALGLEDGAPAFVSPFTFNSTVNVALWNRLRPVFVDIDPFTLNMDPGALATAMAGWNRPGVVLATHVFGAPCDTEALAELAGLGGHRLVFDAAHALGSVRGGRPIGGFGDAEVFSLSGTKLVTSGEGGLVATDDPELAQRIELVRGYGFSGDYRSRRVGLNGKMSELHAALGVLSLRRLPELVARRREIVARYRENLGDMVGWQIVAPGDVSTHKDLVLELGFRRQAVQEALEATGVQTKRYFVPLHTMEAYSRFQTSPLPTAEAVHERTLCVPIYSDLRTDQVDLICEIIVGALQTA